MHISGHAMSIKQKQHEKESYFSLIIIIIYTVHNRDAAEHK